MVADIGLMVQEREARGIAPAFGATRCPHCRLAVRQEPLRRGLGALGWLVVAAVVGFIAGAIAASLPNLSHSMAVNLDAGVGSATFVAISLYAVAETRAARGRRDEAMDRPIPGTPANATTAEGWELTQQAAAVIGVDPVAMWFNSNSTSPQTMAAYDTIARRDLSKLDPEKLRTLPAGIERDLANRHVLHIVLTCTANPAALPFEALPGTGIQLEQKGGSEL